MTRFFLFAFLLSGVIKADQLRLSTEYWKSEAFRKEFNGTYRVNANIEPILSTAERGLLVEMQDLMAKGQRTNTINKLKGSSLLKTSAAIQFNLANVLSENDRIDEAITYYESALKTFPSFLRAHQNLAFATFKSGKVEKAREHLLEAVRLGANNGTVHGLLGYSFLEKGEFEPALRSFREALITQPKEKDWKLGIAQALQNLDRTDESIFIYQNILEEEPDHSGILLQLALIYHDQDEVEKAVTYLEYLRRKGELDDAYTFLLGTLLIGQENVEVGANTLKTVLKKEDFKTPDLALNSIQFCFQQNLNPLALELHGLIKEKDLSPRALISYQRLKAQILFAKTPNDPEGLKILDELIAKNPLDSHSLLLKGQQLVIAKESAQALIIFEQL